MGSCSEIALPTPTSGSGALQPCGGTRMSGLLRGDPWQFQKPQGRAGESLPPRIPPGFSSTSCYAPISRGGGGGAGSICTCLTSNFGSAISYLTCQGKPSQSGGAGPRWPHGAISAETDVPATGTPPGKRQQEWGESKAFPEDCPFQSHKRRNVSELIPGR